MLNIASGSVIGVAVGLTLMYLMLSLIGTILNEFAAMIVQLRSTTLQAALIKILDDPTLRKNFYDNGLIASANDAVGRHVSYLSSKDFAMTVLSSLDPTKPIPLLADIKQSVEVMPDTNIRDVLLASIATAGDDIEKLRDSVATWFDSAMDRVSGSYKRYLKYISFALGIVIAVAFNADSVYVGKVLWQDTDLRTQMVKIAAGLDKTSPPSSESATTDVVALNAAFEKAETALKPLPIGWGQPDSGQTTFTDWCLRIAGWLITGLAVSLGAPFWFDVLTKFMTLRGTGDKPVRADNNT
jgi:hypothetical protein